jgi:hypothetical protein
MFGITTKQIKLLRVLAAKTFPDDQLYHDWLYEQFFVNSTKELRQVQANAAIKFLLGQSKVVRHAEPESKIKSGTGTAGDGQAYLTGRQSWKIGELVKALGWADEPSRLEGFLTRQTGGKVTTLRMLSRSEASKTIMGLEKILRSNHG